MNVTFHTLTGLAAAAVLSSKQKDMDTARLLRQSDLPLLFAGFAAGVIMHGLLDFAPHSYPIKSAVDVLLSLALFFVALLVVHLRHRLLLGVCFFGSIFPDLVDLGPAIVNKRLGWSLPVVNIFPWHWRQYSGSIYDGSRGAESLLYHMLVVGGSIGLLYAYWGWLFSREARA